MSGNQTRAAHLVFFFLLSMSAMAIGWIGFYISTDLTTRLILSGLIVLVLYFGFRIVLDREVSDNRIRFTVLSVSSGLFLGVLNLFKYFYEQHRLGPLEGIIPEQ